MARKRMFSAELVGSDRFLELSVSAQLLYFHLGIHADDDGFVASARRVALCSGCQASDLDILEEQNFIIRFPSGVLVIVDWRINNTIRKDRSVETIYQQEMDSLEIINGRYVKKADNQTATVCQPNDNQVATNCQPIDNQMTTQNRVDKNRVEENREEQSKGDCPALVLGSAFTPPGLEEVTAYCKKAGLQKVDPRRFWDYYSSVGWMIGKLPMQNWHSALRNWNEKERDHGKTAVESGWTVGTVL